MAHNLDMTNDRVNFAFLGDRKDIWHRLGDEMQPGMTIEDWADASGLNWNAIKVPAIASLSGSQFDHLDAASRFRRVEGQNFVVRSDTGHPLGYVSDRYQPCQPQEVLDWFQRYIGVDDRFVLDTAGSLKQGEIIFVTAKFIEPLSIVGDKHIARLLMTTTFDGTGSTINKALMTRVVCNNTLDAGLAERGATVRTRHNTKFDVDKVAGELANIAKGFTAYASMAEAMALRNMAVSEVSDFFKACLEIPFDAKQGDLSTKKQNQFTALQSAYRATVAEGTKAGTAWAALNTITRYVDHDKTVRDASGSRKDEARVLSANFGSGAALKAKAVNLLMPDFKVPELVAA